MQPIEETALAVQQPYAVQLRQIENSLLGFLSQHGLPNESILVPIRERIVVFSNIEYVLEKISSDQKGRSTYLSKYLSAISSGIFDAALNYLWDETISQLRNRVAQYDLSYFYDNAVGNSEKRKELKSEEDLSKIDDSSLINGAKSIELISDLGFRHLDYIRTMRNWASAAHPNQNELTGLQLITWLETCIIEVISLPLSNIVVEIGRFLSNVRTNAISAEGARDIAPFFARLNQDQVNKLSSGLYGIYTRTDTSQRSRDNVKNIIPYLWGRVSEETRQNFGIKYGRFVANNDEAERVLARQFLDMVSGRSYIPDSLLASEVETAVDNLLTAHRNLNNFYNEPAFARSLQRLIGSSGVPLQVDNFYTLGVVEVFLSNGNGVTVNANGIYTSLLNSFNEKQATAAVLSFRNERISSKLQFRLCKDKYKELLTLMRPKVVPAVKEIIDDIESYNGPLEKMKDDSRISRKVKNLQVILSSS